ncbi:MAG: ABC transporter substrate-binding protein [Alphaproteobacteria bacterium]
MLGVTRRGIMGLAVGAAALTTMHAGEAGAQTAITFVTPNPSAITIAPLWVAIGEGYFAEAGLDITVEAVDGSSQVLQAMAAGQAQIGLPGPGPVLAARERGVDVVFIYNLYAKSVFGVMVKDESAYQSPADLKGQVVGIGTADGAEVAFARAILSDLGMSEGTDYTFLPVGDGGTAAVAFMRDEVEAYAAAVVDSAILASRGLQLREITPEQYLAFFGNGFAALRETIDQNPELIESFGKALVRGMKFALDPANLETVLAHCAAGNPQEGEDQAFATSLLAATLERMTPTDAFLDQGFGYQPPEHWQLWHQSAVDSGTLSAALPDLEAAYTNEYIEGWNAD